MREKLLGSRRLLAFASAVFICLGGLVQQAHAVWRAAGNVVSVVREVDGATLTLSSGARVRINFVSPDVVRVRLAPGGTFDANWSYALESKDRKRPLVDVRQPVRGPIELTTKLEGARVVIQRTPFLVTVYDANNQVVVADDPARPASFDTDTGAHESIKRREPTELYYGFGEKALPLSRHDQHMTMWNFDTYRYERGTDPIYQSIPFFIALKSGRAYGIFLDNTYRSFFDMGKTAQSRYTFGASGGELNYYVFTGGRERSPRNVLRDYTDLTGRTPLPPLWALGYHQSRYSYYPESRVREIARTFREKRIPADVIYLDIDHMEGYRVFTWSREHFPNPRRMLSDLRADGFRTVTIVDPGIKVDENYSAYTEGRAGNFFCRTATGEEFRARVWPGVCAFPDFTNPRAREWFGSLYRTLLDDGVSGFWNDMNEPATFPPDDLPEPPIYFHPAKTFPLDVRHDGEGRGGDHARYHNVYGMLMARSTFEGLRRLRPDARPLVITRAGFAGVQRFSSVWTGDNAATWDHLALTIPMLTNMSVSGIPLVGADIGGYAGSPSGELYARWLQAAILTPFVRTHTEKGTADQEPWSYGQSFEDINRRTIELRYQLLPYIYTLFHEHWETGAPVMRPLWYEYPADARTHLLDDQYMVGRDLLVAPVLREGQVKRGVYFPKGAAWVDWWTGARYEGGTFAEVDAPLNRLPLFARAGATVPTQPVVQHTGEVARVPLTLVVVPFGVGVEAASAQSGNTPGGDLIISRIYEDAGDGYDYQRGAFRTITATVGSNAVRFARTGSYNVSRAVASIEMLGLKSRPRQVRLGNQTVDNAVFDAASGRLSVPLPGGTLSDIAIAP